MNKEKKLGLSPRIYKKNKEVHEEIFDDEIKASETVDRPDILVRFWVPDVSMKQRITGRRTGIAIRWHPRNRTLEVKVIGMERIFKIEKKLCICAYRTEMPPKSKLPPKTVVRVGKDGKEKKVSNPLYWPKIMEMTKKDRDKLKVIWE